MMVLDGYWGLLEDASHLIISIGLFNEENLVQDHVLKMIAHLNELEILGAEIDGETQVDILLMSLSEYFNNFRLTYNMSKSHYSLAELLKEL